MDKKRCNNFTKDEVDVLVTLVENSKDIIECKKTDAITSGAKENEWKKVAEKFNALCGTGRNAKMLRSKWDSLKKCVKKEYAQHKQRLYQTGGGPSVEIELVGINRRVLGLVGIGATGTVSVYDSDYVPENVASSESNTVEEEQIVNVIPVSADASISLTNNVELQDLREIICYDTVSNSDDKETTETPNYTWSSWNPQKLRGPKSEILQVGASANTKVARKFNFSTPESTSAKLQKQRSGKVYEDLARKKIEFIDFQMNLMKEEAEQKEKRLAQKHELEMKILEIDLKNKENSH